MTSLVVSRIDCTSGNHLQIQERVGYDGRIPVRLVMSSGAAGVGGAKEKGLDNFPTERNKHLTT